MGARRLHRIGAQSTEPARAVVHSKLVAEGRAGEASVAGERGLAVEGQASNDAPPVGAVLALQLAVFGLGELQLERRLL